MNIQDKIDEYLTETKLKDYGYWDDPIDLPFDIDEIVDALKSFQESYSGWNFAIAETYAKRSLKLIKNLERDIKKELKDLYKAEKEKEKEGKL